MKKHHLLLAVIICLSNFLFGTGDLYITLKGLSINPTNANYYIKEVIDVRLNKEFLGFVTTAEPKGHKAYKAKFEKNYPIRLKQDFFTELRDAGLVAESPETNRIPVVIKINHIFLSEVISNNTKHVCVEVNIDFYTCGTETHYFEYTYINGIFLQCPERQNKKAELFAANLVDQINRALKGFHMAMDNEKNYHLPVDESALYRREITPSQNPNSSENGIFRSYNDFRYGILDTDLRFVPAEEPASSGADIIRFIFSDDSNVRQNVWGVQYNQFFYYNLNGYFFRLIQENDTYYLHDIQYFRQKLDVQNRNNIIGAIGALAMGGGTNITIYEADEIPRFKIDHFSGLARPELDYDTRNFEGYLLFYVRKTKNKDPELWINNTFHCKFKPDTYYEIIIPVRDEPVEVTLVTGDEQYFEVLQDVVFNESFYEIDYKRGKFVPFPKRGIVSRKTIISDIENGRLVKVDAISNDPKND